MNAPTSTSPASPLTLDPQHWPVTAAKLVGLVSMGLPFTELEAQLDLGWFAWAIKCGDREDLPPTAELAARWGWTLDEVNAASKRWLSEGGRG